MPTKLAGTIKEPQGERHGISPLDHAQVLKATKALSKHIAEAAKEKNSEKAVLLGSEQDETVIWLTITTKKFIVDSKRLKPARMFVSCLFACPID